MSSLFGAAAEHKRPLALSRVGIFSVRYNVTPTPPTAAAVPSAHVQHTNRLAHEKSPYLLQHAHNPVEWYPWGEEAFAKARREKKPIFLSIGYSTCHWCHVMERESFENEEIAAFMNSRFVISKSIGRNVRMSIAFT